MSKDIYTMEDLNHFWMPSGVPCFIADRDGICEIVENMGFQIYYLLANNYKETTVSTTVYPLNDQTKHYGYGSYNQPSSITENKVSVERSGGLFKVVKNFVGRAVSTSSDELPNEFADVIEECLYTMPKISLDIVQKLDEFFRLVHSQHGTESIVILTYDTNKDDSSGWGVLVPEQSNTAAHCKYDADSIASIKPEDVIIVGSVHSHPEMAAYASGTDHDDQADFDGVHITYGWQKTVNAGATQHYAELQMSGKSYKLNIDDVFESNILVSDPDPEVVEWSTKVKKALPPIQGVSSQSISTNKVSPPISSSSKNTQTGTQTGVYKFKPSRSQLLVGTNYFDAIRDLDINGDAVFMSQVSFTLNEHSHCFVCESPCSLDVRYFDRCGICDSPIVSDEDHISEVSDAARDYIREYRLPNSVPVYLVSKDEEDSSKVLLINITEEVAHYTNPQSLSYDDGPFSSEKIYSDDYEYVNLPTQDSLDDLEDIYMWCCGSRINSTIDVCSCSTKIYPHDAKEFADILKYDGDIYAVNSQCGDCAFFYDNPCPPYRDLLKHYVKSKGSFIVDPYVKSITGCSNFLHVSEFVHEQKKV